MDGLLHLVHRGGDWADCGPVQSPSRCIKCNSPSISGQCTNFILFDVANCTLKGLSRRACVIGYLAAVTSRDQFQVIRDKNWMRFGSSRHAPVNVVLHAMYH